MKSLENKGKKMNGTFNRSVLQGVVNIETTTCLILYSLDIYDILSIA